MRTIIDILKRGNQEMFHSSMFAWLLDLKAEHNLGNQFLRSVAEKLAERKHGELKDELNKTGTIDSVQIETTLYKSRYDIEVRIGRMIVVFENKTKSFGGLSQFRKYETDNVLLIALGLCKKSFSHDIADKYPLLTYQDTLDILSNFPEQGNDFSVLIKHYCLFLERELSILKSISDCYKSGHTECYPDIIELISHSYPSRGNDERFFNLYYLEEFREVLSESPSWVGAIWNTNKNEQSGVWLENYNSLPPKYSFNKLVCNLQKRRTVKLWFHIELWAGMFGEDPDSPVGTLQLRCSVDGDSGEILDDFKQIFQCNDREHYVSRIRKNVGSFYLVSRYIFKKELVFEVLKNQLINFAQRFGSFSE